jgi:hypothetical protein
MIKDASILTAEGLFYPEDGGSRFLQTVGKITPGYMASHPTRLYLHFQLPL